jgi:hypothetical protein
MQNLTVFMELTQGKRWWLASWYIWRLPSLPAPNSSAVMPLDFYQVFGNRHFYLNTPVSNNALRLHQRFIWCLMQTVRVLR